MRRVLQEEPVGWETVESNKCASNVVLSAISLVKSGGYIRALGQNPATSQVPCGNCFSLGAPPPP